MVAVALHPAERRRLADVMPPQHGHDVELRPLGGRTLSPIVGATEQDFIAAVLADVAGDGWSDALAGRRQLRTDPGDGVLELTQPIHRRFHLALYELVCRQPGYPPVDPRSLDGMGLVLRRNGDSGREGWMSDGGRKKGWVPLIDELAEPDPARRASVRGGQAGLIDSLLANRRPISTAGEQVLQLFVAPPAISAARGRTILYGLIPVTSSETSEAAVSAPNYAELPAADAQGMVDHLSSYLKSRPATTLARGGALLDPAWQPLQLPDAPNADDLQLNAFAIFLQQLMVELDGFGSGAGAATLQAALAQVMLAVPTGWDDAAVQVAAVSAADFLPQAAAILLNGDENTSALRLPQSWPDIDTTLGDQLTGAALLCLADRFAAVTPKLPKFDGDGWTYQVRPFVRTRGSAGCPSRIVWGDDYSPPFRILPWWDGDGPATRVALPGLSDFRKMKPNVSFQLPPSLANLLQGDMKKLAQGEPGGGGGVDIYWLCSFSLPIITLCAFIVLNIFLSLFNLLFSWMAFIKICIPIPRPK